MDYISHLIQDDIDRACDKAWQRCAEMNRAYTDMKAIAEKYNFKIYVVDSEAVMRTKTTQFKLLE